MGIIPGEGIAKLFVHSQFQITHDDYWGLKSIGNVEGTCRKIETFFRRRGKQHYVFGVTMGGKCTTQDVALLSSCWHASRGSSSLDAEKHKGYFWEVSKPEKLLHEWNSRAASCGEGASTVPSSAQGYTYGRYFVFGLDNRVFSLATSRINPQAFTILVEVVNNGCGGRQRIPCCNCGSPINTTKCYGSIAIN